VPEDTQPEVEYLGPEESPSATPANGRRWAVVAGVTAGVLAIAAVAAWGATQFLSGGGPGAASAVPANALAYVALDLDPSAGQKVEAYRTLRKFPAIRDKIGSGDDLRRSLVEGLLSSSPCKGLSYDQDVGPWLGNRIAMAVVPGAQGGQPSPFAAVQVTDEDQARAGVQALTECAETGSGPSAVGTAFTDDGYLIVAQSDAEATRIVEDAASSSLADDAGYQNWVGEAGGEGIITGYVDADAPKALFRSMGPMGPIRPMGGMGGSSSFDDSGTVRLAGRAPVFGDSTSPSPAPTPGPDFFQRGPRPRFGLGMGGMSMLPLMMGGPARLFDDFKGAAFSLRFADGALELESATSSLGSVTTTDAGDSGIKDLPTSTAVAFGFAVGDTFVQDLLDSLASTMGQAPLDAAAAGAERETGLSLPEDVQTLLGQGVSVALDSSTDLDRAFSDGESKLPVAVRIKGDPNEIVPVLDKLIKSSHAENDVVVKTGDNVVAVGFVSDQVAAVAGDGSLGDSDAFRNVLPDLDQSVGGLFVNFDAGDWLTNSAGDDESAKANLAPLDSLGITGTRDGDVLHGVVRLSTDD
jgi:hypothetical protein